MSTPFEQAAAAPTPGPRPAPAMPVVTTEALAGLADRALAEHVEVYEQLHRDLQTALSAIDGA